MQSERAKPSRRPRYRYILFRVAAPVSRVRFVEALRRSGAGDRVWLTRFDGVHGILRCGRGEEEAARRLLGGGLQGLAVETLSTSGTIAALERRHPDLKLGSGH